MSQYWRNCALQVVGHGVRALVAVIQKEAPIYVSVHLDNMQRCIDAAMEERE